jgi:hypothetical protein
MRQVVPVTDDRADGFAQGAPPAVAPRGDALKLIFAEQGNRTTLQLIPGPGLMELQDGLQDELEPMVLPYSKALFQGAVQECQEAWWNAVVLGGAYWKSFADPRFPSRRPYARRSERPVPVEVFEGKVLPRLAEAGRRLFEFVFRPGGQQYGRVREVGKQLRDTLSRTEDLRIVVENTGYLAPWSLLHFGGPDEPRPELFLGHRHLVEHDFPGSAPADARLSLQSGAAFHGDLKLDSHSETRDFGIIANTREWLARLGISLREGHFRDDFLKGLRAGPAESLFYFICHGGRTDAEGGLEAASPRLFLTKASGDYPAEPVVPNDIHANLADIEALKGEPLVFINACQGLRSGSFFYVGFAEQFMDKWARGVLGPEIEMPAVFARDFAQQFFTELARGGPENSVGRVLLRLRRRYMALQNPLGLLYSLYGGGELYVVVAPVP